MLIFRNEKDTWIKFQTHLHKYTHETAPQVYNNRTEMEKMGRVDWHKRSERME